ncbi:hypothetical protein EDD80_105104 [Anseongella ginsenosidimutans]|uniref:Ig-like domain-containing protein n=1 Tax=Anseongella ginsenosidimutans TaxID=496056 RepID=A0A4R3KQX0_9SPHI|nr:hypothetical protein [Anseongella ginsenosidimutans]QEC52900.1 hypothetical protein FRZ59_11515 [Anseongella ginsenosidimutans]TCS87290.1 hypothetical protein EDD80_105104 [Anseongella ginsenosidimutans]
MKGQFTFLKMSLVGLFLLGGFAASSQTISTLADFPTADGMAGADALNVKKVYCLNDGVTIPAGSINGGTSTGLTYNWFRIDGNDHTQAAATLSTTTDGEDFVDNSITTPGYYIYRVSAENAETCESAVTEFMVYVLPNITPTIALTGNDSYCVGTSAGATLDASAVSNPTVTEVFAYTFEWYKTGETAPIATGAQLTFAAGAAYGGEYTVKAKYEIAPTCAEGTSAGLTITETALPTAPIITF